jgi:hypothetical protein
VASLERRVEPRVHKRHGFVLTLWSYYEQVRQELSPADYAKALVKRPGFRRGSFTWLTGF